MSITLSRHKAQGPSGASLRASILRNVSHGANDIYWYVLPPVLPLILQEFGLHYAGAGGMIAAYLCMTAVASIFMGKLSDRVRRISLIGYGFLLASAAFCVGALMPLLPLVIVCLVIGGIGVSTYHPPAYASIHDSGMGNGRTYGEFESAGSIAIMLMLALQGLLVAAIGWRGVLAVSVVPGALMGLLLLVLPGASLGGPARSDAVDTPTQETRAVGHGTPVSIAALFILAVMLRFLGINALQSFIPTYLVRSVSMSPSLASFAMGFVFIGAIPGSIIMGRRADRRGNFPVFLAMSATLVPLVPLLGLHLPIVAYPILLVMFGFTSAACMPAQSMILTALTEGRGKGQVFGVLMSMTTFTASASPLLFGLLADSAGLVAAVRWCTLPLAAGWLLSCVVWRMRVKPVS